MTTILGIDAAWTPIEPSGVAVIQLRHGHWHCLAVAPSYNALIDLATGHKVDWSKPTPGSPPDMPRLLQAAAAVAGETVTLVTIDMPVATRPIVGRREADQAVSKAFGGRWCSAHSPSPKRPGSLGEALSSQFASLGYPVATAGARPSAEPSLVEVYPHPALLTLLGRERRVPYKVSRSTSYWPGRNVRDRIERLLSEFTAIDRAIRQNIEGVELILPRPDRVRTLSALKRYEDALDALVCCWVGIKYVIGEAYALGDDTAAIWCPSDSTVTTTTRANIQ